MNTNPLPRKTLADIIMEKITEKQKQMVVFYVAGHIIEIESIMLLQIVINTYKNKVDLLDLF